MKKIVLIILNAAMLFGVWLFAAIFMSTGDAWWSLYTYNMAELSPFNVQISWRNIFVFGAISFAISFILVKLNSSKK